MVADPSMKGQNYLTMVIFSAFFLRTAGCISIKDTSGIKEYLQDQGRAEILAIEIKDRNPDEDSTTYQNAERLYNNAAGGGNGWAKGILADARIKGEVNVSTEDYTNSSAGKAISEFLSLGSYPFYAKKLSFYTLGSDPAYAKKYFFHPTKAAAIVSFLETLIGKIKQQHDQWVDLAIRALEREFSRARWTTFENTTLDWIDDKYNFQAIEIEPVVT